MVNREVLTELIEGSGLSYRQNSVSWIFCCPKCGKKDKLYIRKKDGRFVCWVCAETDGYRGKPEYALADLLSRSVSDVQEQLYGYTRPDTADGAFEVKLSDFMEPDEEPEVQHLERRFPPDFFPIEHKASRNGAEYLEGRGVPLMIAAQYGIQYCPPKRRIIFPIRDNKRLVGWQDRAIDPTEIATDSGVYEVPKAITSKGTDREHLVMFADRMEGSSHVIVSEGPIDAIKAHLCGGNIATMGKAISNGQIKLILDSKIENIYLALDPDAAPEMDRIIKAFYGRDIYSMAAPKPYKDLGEMPMEAVLDLFRSAPKVSHSNVFVHIKNHW